MHLLRVFAVNLVLALLVFPAHAGLLAHWTFDEDFGETAQSSTGNYHGQVVNGERVTGRVGAGALRLNGTNSYMFVGGENSWIAFTNTSYTITWWQKFEGTNDGWFYIYAMEDGANRSGGYSAYISSWNQNEIMVNHHIGSEFALPLFTAAHVRREWEHFAVVYDGQILRFYENGILSAQTEKSALVQDGDDPLVIGAVRQQDGTFTGHFSGTLDDIRFYDHALTSAEIRGLGPEPGVAITKQPLSYRIGVNSSVTLEVAATAIGTNDPVTYSWELNGSPIFVTGQTLTVRPTTTGALKYRVLVRAGDTSVYSDEAQVEAVDPSTPRLLLHYDFENDTEERIVDSTGQFHGLPRGVLHAPGRVGNSSVRLNPQREGYIRVPAAGTDLELVAGPYTIACWILPQLSLPQLPSVAGGSLHAQLGSWPRNIVEMGSPSSFGRDGPGYLLQWLGWNTIIAHHGSDTPVIVNATGDAGNRWQHLAWVNNTKSNILYLNGTVISAVPSPDGIVGTGRDDLFLGRTTTLQSFMGLIDDFRIYNDALTEDEIAALVNVPAPSPGIVFYKIWDSERIGSQLTLLWQASDPSQIIQSSPRLGPTAEWTPIPGNTSERNTVYQLFPQPPYGTLFYRLHPQ